MRARNREINIFNMSLLDILTGMLGAFLFLMLGLLPYYAKLSKVKDITPEMVKQLKEENMELKQKNQLQEQQIADLKKQIDDLQKMLAKSGGGPLTAEQVQELMDKLNQLRDELAKAQDQIQSLQIQLQKSQSQLQEKDQQLQQAKQQVDDITKDRDYWKGQQGTVAIVSQWDSPATDIDVLVMNMASGKIYSPKGKDNVLGKACVYDGDDSHGPGYATNHEGLLVYLEDPGDYLVFYRVPKGADPSTYANLHGNFLYTEGLGKGNGVQIRENSLCDAKAGLVKSPGLYAWAVFTYDPKKSSVTSGAPKGKIPNGILLPEQAPQPTSTPAATPAPSPSPGNGN